MQTIHVCLESIVRLKDAIDANAKQGEASVAVFRQLAMALLSEFENKLNELEHIREIKATALNRCEMKRSLDDEISCATEERAYNVACGRCLQCEILINQARTAIAEFADYADSYRQAISNLSSRSEIGLTRIEAIIQEYMTSK